MDPHTGQHAEHFGKNSNMIFTMGELYFILPAHSYGFGVVKELTQDAPGRV
jgi:hypothetical protein